MTFTFTFRIDFHFAGCLCRVGGLLVFWGGVGFSFPFFLASCDCSATQSCLTLCDPVDRSTPGLPVHHQLPELAQTHVHRVGDAIQPSHPLSSPSPPALNLSQHQGLSRCGEHSFSPSCGTIPTARAPRPTTPRASAPEQEKAPQGEAGTPQRERSPTPATTAEKAGAAAKTQHGQKA